MRTIGIRGARTAGLAAMVALCAWGSGTRGNGQLQTETRSVAGFTGVTNETPLSVEVSQGSAFSVTVTADSNLLPLIRTELDGGKLRIYTKGDDIRASASSIVHVVLPALERAALNGSGNLQIHGFSSASALELDANGSGNLSYEGRAGDTKVSVAGSGDVALRGQAARLAIQVAGSGNVDAKNLPATSAKVNLAGSGNTALTVNGDVDLNIMGSGNVRGTFNGGTVDVSTLGSGDVRWSGTSKEGKIRQLGSGDVKHE